MSTSGGRRFLGRWFVVGPLFTVPALIIGIAIGASGKNTTVNASNAGTVATSTHSASPAASQSPTAAPTPTLPAVPNPQANGSGSCSYTLGNSASADNYLTGEIDITNTGNIGVTVKASISWPQEGYSPITVTKTVNVPHGASAMPVSFNYNAGNIASGSNVIDNLQAWEQGHPGSTNDCTYNITITGTYGAAH